MNRVSKDWGHIAKELGTGRTSRAVMEKSRATIKFETAQQTHRRKRPEQVRPGGFGTGDRVSVKFSTPDGPWFDGCVTNHNWASDWYRLHSAV